MDRNSMRKRIRGLISVLSLVLLMEAAGSGIIGFALGEPLNQSIQPDGLLQTGNGSIKGGAEVHMNGLISLLQKMGLDISYGEDGGTVFSMVDQSLTQVITDLSSGNTSGFIDIPLIQETLKYFGISPEEIIVQPEDISGYTGAIDRYNQKYSGNQNSTF